MVCNPVVANWLASNGCTQKVILAWTSRLLHKCTYCCEHYKRRSSQENSTEHNQNNQIPVISDLHDLHEHAHRCLLNIYKKSMWNHDCQQKRYVWRSYVTILAKNLYTTRTPQTEATTDICVVRPIPRIVWIIFWWATKAQRDTLMGQTGTSQGFQKFHRLSTCHCKEYAPSSRFTDLGSKQIQQLWSPSLIAAARHMACFTPTRDWATERHNLSGCPWCENYVNTGKLMFLERV